MRIADRLVFMHKDSRLVDFCACALKAKRRGLIIYYKLGQSVKTHWGDRLQCQYNCQMIKKQCFQFESMNKYFNKQTCTFAPNFHITF